MACWPKRNSEEGAFIGVHSWSGSITIEEANEALNAGDIDQATYDSVLSRGVDDEGNVFFEGTDFPVGHPFHQEYIDILELSGVPNAEEFYYYTINVAPAADIHALSAEELSRFMLVRNKLFTNIPQSIMNAQFKGALSSIQGLGIGNILTQLYNADAEKARDVLRVITPRVSGFTNTLISEAQNLQQTVERQLNSSEQGEFNKSSSDGYSNDRRNNFWLSYANTDAEQESNNLDLGYESDIDRVSIGFDRQVARNTKLGVYFSDADGEINYLQNGGKNTLDYQQIGVYGKHRLNRSFFEFGGIYLKSDGDLKKKVSFDGSTQHLSARISADVISLNTLFGYDLLPSESAYNITPVAGVNAYYASIDGFTEQGSIIAYTVNAFGAGRIDAKLGVRAGLQHKLGHKPAALNFTTYRDVLLP